MPHNFVLIGFIKNTFPNAKIIYCDRDPMDTCLSLYKRTFVHKHFHSYVYDQKNLGKYYLLHKDLMSFWKKLYGSSIFQIRYEDLIEEQEKNTRNLLPYYNCIYMHDVFDYSWINRKYCRSSVFCPLAWDNLIICNCNTPEKKRY